MTPELWVIFAAILAALACSLIGTFLVVRGESMLGDAISHAVLPGLVIAFLVSGSRGVVPMIIGAAAAGLLTALLTTMVSRTKRVYGDAALGLVFTFLFAVGVLLVSIYTDRIDLDQECVLYGEIAYTPWDTLLVDGISWGPRAIWVLGGAFLINALFIALFYRQLKICSFDPELARSVGISPTLWQYLLMGMVSLTVVAAFESVGAILVVALLVIPAATARLVTSQLSRTLVGSLLMSLIAALGGYVLADRTDSSIAGSIAVTAGVLFAGVFSVSLVRRRLLRQKFAVH